MLKEIKDQFECDPEKYFEILRQPKTKPKFKYLSKPKSGGRIAVADKQYQASGDDKSEEFPAIQSSGTLTMFCSQNGNHYALTCFHVACATDEQRFQQAFNGQELFDIQERRESYEFLAKEREYYYIKKNEVFSTDENDNPNNYIPFGKFSKCSLNRESDIMSIKVCKDVEIECTTSELDHPDWVSIADELLDRTNRNDPVSVEKFGFPSSLENSGYIERFSCNYKCKKGPSFKNAVKVKGNSPSFLKYGDSGALISFMDKNNKKQPFAYGVLEVDNTHNEDNNDLESSEDSSEDSDEDLTENSNKDSSDDSIKGSSKNSINGEKSQLNDEIVSDDDSVIFLKEPESVVLCFRLNTALKDLELSDAGCFKNCGHKINSLKYKIFFLCAFLVIALFVLYSDFSVSGMLDNNRQSVNVTSGDTPPISHPEDL